MTTDGGYTGSKRLKWYVLAEECVRLA